jgi:hypothetical protein
VVAPSFANLPRLAGLNRSLLNQRCFVWRAIENFQKADDLIFFYCDFAARFMDFRRP